MPDDPKHLLWRLRNNDTAKHLCGLAADRIEALEREVRELYDDKAHDAEAMKAARASRRFKRVASLQIYGWPG